MAGAATTPDPPLGVAGKPPVVKSFAAALTGNATASSCNDIIPDFGQLSTFRGEPALLISREEILTLSEPFKNFLVGRFAYSRPPMELIRKFVVSLGLKGDYPVGLLDNNHVLFCPCLEKDYMRLFVRRSWFVQNSPMTISKWTINFKADHEASIAPIWVSFPELPLPFFNMKYLNKIASLIGRPLKVDAATSDFRRSSVARVLIELDVSKAPIRRIWIGDDSKGAW